MKDTVSTLLTFLLVGTIGGILMWSCEEEEIRIPFGYDPTFNYLEVLKIALLMPTNPLKVIRSSDAKLLNKTV